MSTLRYSFMEMTKKMQPCYGQSPENLTACFNIISHPQGRFIYK